MGGCDGLLWGVARNSEGEPAGSGIGVRRAPIVDWMLKWSRARMGGVCVIIGTLIIPGST